MTVDLQVYPVMKAVIHHVEHAHQKMHHLALLVGLDMTLIPIPVRVLLKIVLMDNLDSMVQIGFAILQLITALITLMIW